MKRRARRNRGFSLPEVMVASAMFGLLAAAFCALQAAVVRGHADTLRRSMAQDAAAMSLNAIGRTAASATFIERPSSGSAPSLTIWENYDADAGGRLVAELPVRVIHFCLDRKANRLLRLVRTGATYPLGSPDCAASGGFERYVVAAGPKLAVGLQFTRSSQDPGAIHVHYRAADSASSAVTFGTRAHGGS